jgi:sec-independent protein translocase protein TatA
MFNLYAFGFGAPVEWIVVGIVALLLLGPKKLPELARSLGKSAGELKKGLDESKETFNAAMAAEPPEAQKLPEPSLADKQPVATSSSTPAP